MKQQKAITLIALVITIIVLLILAGVSIWIFSNEGPIERAKMSKFATEFREIEEQVKLYMADKQADFIIEKQKLENEQQILPVSNKVQKEEIQNKYPSLQITIEELTEKSIEEVNLYWINKEVIGSKLTHNYLIDVETKQIYDYEGEKIYGSFWHTLEKSVEPVEDNLDPPQEPVIDSYDGYPILTRYGVKNNQIKILYDKKRNIENYYSIDAGQTWQKYTGAVTLAGGTILAKSINTVTGVEVMSSKTVSTPNDAVGEEAYDENINTFIAGGSKKCLMIDEEVWGWTVNIQGYRSAASTIISILDKNNKELYRIDPGYGTNYNLDIVIPQDAYKLCIEGGDSFTNLKEITMLNAKPTFTKQGEEYPTLTQNGVEWSRTIKRINYPLTEGQKLYKIDNGEWKIYQNNEIELEIGQTIYAKQIDQNGDEIENSYTFPSQTENIGAIWKEAYDGNLDTFYLAGNVATRYMKIDESVWGKKLRILSKGYQIVYFKNQNLAQLYRFEHRQTDYTHVIPKGTTMLEYYFNEDGGIYEMMLVD